MRVFGAMVVGALVVLAGWWSVRDDLQPERSSTDRAVMAPRPRAVSDAALAAAGDAAMREDVSLLTEEIATTEVVADVGADVGAAPEVAPPRSTTGGLEGRVLFDGGVLASDLRVSVERVATADDDTVTWSLSEVSGDDGTFRVEALGVGTHRVCVVGSVDFAFEPLAPPVDADVHADTVVRLADIDLRGALFAREFTVTDEHGAPLTSARGTFSGTSSYENNDIEVRDGRGRIVTQHRSVDVWLGAVGRRSVQLTGVDGARTVVLAPALAVDARLLDPSVLASDVEVTVQLHSGLGADNFVLGEISSSAIVEFDAEGRAVLLAPLERTYTVVVSLRLRSGGPSQRIAFEPPLTVEVAEQLGAPFVDVPLTREQVDAARAVR